jgi:uncharacterized protein YkwD
MANFPCRECGAAIHDPAWRFCPYCGGPLTGPFGQGRTTAPQPNPCRRIPVSLWVAGLLLLLIAAAAFVQVFIPLAAPAALIAMASALPSPAATREVPVTENTSAPATTPETSPLDLNCTGNNTIPETPVNTTRTTPAPLPATAIAGPVIHSTGTSPSLYLVPATGSSPEVPVINATSLEARVHEQVNRVRQDNGLSRLSMEAALTSLARAHSTDMASHGYFGHVNLHEMDPTARGAAAGYSCRRNHDTYYTYGIAENLFATYRYGSVLFVNSGATGFDWKTEETIAEETVDAWMHSPDHRENLLATGVDREGIGVAISDNDLVFVTEDFC